MNNDLKRSSFMTRILCACVFLLLWVNSSQGQNISNQRMFRDLVVTNYVTQAIGDTVYKFHVKMVEDNSHHMAKRYHWFHQGKLRSTVGSHAGKLLHGPLEKFDRDGNLLEKGEFAQGLKEGDWLWWYPNGFVARQCSWRRGWQTGTFNEYHANGSLYRTGKYKKDKLHGSLTLYNSEGGVDFVERYKRGVLVKSKSRKTTKEKRSNENDEPTVRKKKRQPEKEVKKRKGPGQESSATDTKTRRPKKEKKKESAGEKKKSDISSKTPPR